MTRKNFFKDESERLLWIRLNAERILYALKKDGQTDLSLGELHDPFSIIRISQNQLEYDETTRDTPRYSFEELVLPHEELYRLTINRGKQKLAEIFGIELGKIADELL